MYFQEFSEVNTLFVDAVTSKSLPTVRKRLEQMRLLEEDLASECCLKTLYSISDERDYRPIVKEIVDSKLFEGPHHHKLPSVSPTLISDGARWCTSSKHLYEIVSHLASRLKSSIPETLDILGDGGYSALHLSVMCGDFKATSYLLELGSDCNKKSKSGNSAISLAVAYGQDCVVSLLLNRSDVNSRDSDHDTPLMFAAWNSAPKIVSGLIQHGADVNRKNKYGSNSIWNAVYQSSAQCVLILLNNNSTMDESCEGTDLFFNEGNSGEKIAKLYPGHKRSLLWVAVDRISCNECSLKVLLVLLEAGYDVTKEHWLRKGTKSQSDLPHYLHSDPDLFYLLQYMYKRPQNLKDLCRNSLRKHHRSSSVPFHEWVHMLCIPSSLRDYLTMSYLIK